MLRQIKINVLHFLSLYDIFSINKKDVQFGIKLKGYKTQKKREKF